MADQDPNTPSWLTEDAGGASPAPAAADPMPPVVTDSTNDTPAVAAASSSTKADDDITKDDPDLPGVILMMRLANMGASIALIVCAVRRSLLSVLWKRFFGNEMSMLWLTRCFPLYPPA